MSAPRRAPDPRVQALAERARAAIEAAEAAGELPTDRAEWMAAAAQDIADGRLAAEASVHGVRSAITLRANELICMGPLVSDREIPAF